MQQFTLDKAYTTVLPFKQNPWASNKPLKEKIAMNGKRIMFRVLGGQLFTLSGPTTTIKLVRGKFADGSDSVELEIDGVIASSKAVAPTTHAVYEIEISNGKLRWIVNGMEYPSVAYTGSPIIDLVLFKNLVVEILIMNAPCERESNIERENLLKRCNLPDIMVPQLMDRNVSTIGWAGLVSQHVPAQLIADDKAAGYDRIANYHDLAYRAHAEAPVRLSHIPPDGLVQKMLPPGMINRLPFNIFHIDENGDFYDTEFQRYLEVEVAHGGRLSFTLMHLGNEDWPKPIKDAGKEAKIEYITVTLPSMWIEAHKRLGKWYEKQSDAVKQSIVGIETFNEPAIYKRFLDMQDTIWTKSRIINLFGDHQLQIAKEGMSWWKGPIMPTLWGYSGNTEELSLKNSQGINQFMRIRQALGNRLIWSVHCYPDWVNKFATNPDRFEIEIRNKFKACNPDPVVFTEMNAGYYEPTKVNQREYSMTRAFANLVDDGFGFTWFPGLNDGHALLQFWGTPRIRHIDRLAMFLDISTIHLQEPWETYQRFKSERSYFDDRDKTEDWFHAIFKGHGGQTLEATKLAPTVLLGGNGNDTFTVSSTHSTWVFGKNGDDTIYADRGPFCIVNMGNGNDTVYLGSNLALIYGGGGSDRFIMKDSGVAIIDNFAVGADKIVTNDLTVTVSVEINDLIIKSANGTIKLLNRASVANIDSIFD